MKKLIFCLLFLVIAAAACAQVFQFDPTEKGFMRDPFHYRLALISADPDQKVRVMYSVQRDLNGDTRLFMAGGFQLFRQSPSKVDLWFYPAPANYSFRHRGFNNPAAVLQLEFVDQKFIKAGIESWHYLKSWTVNVYLTGCLDFSKQQQSNLVNPRYF